MEHRPSPPLIYNLFPRLAGTIGQWSLHAKRARQMGFNWIFLNPVTQPGFSGSLYSILDHYRICPDFLEPGESGDGLDRLKEQLDNFRRMGLRPIMDLVINHTAIDSPLVQRHPQWYKRDSTGKVLHPSAIDPADSRNVTVWGDLAEIDNHHSPDRDRLWAFWRQLVRSNLELGFAGFRCDAAYKVPTQLWAELVQTAQEIDPEVVFFAETLGCRLEEVRSLQPAGLHFLFNSSKYWQFDAPWALEQHEEFGAIAPSISFPESHDTPRLAAQTNGSIEVQKQRYLFAALFSAGLMMPIGYEFLFRNPLDVVQTRPTDWEVSGMDLSASIAQINAMKCTHPGLQGEGHWRALNAYDQPTLGLLRTWRHSRVLVLVNKDWHAQQKMSLPTIDLPSESRLYRFRHDGMLDQTPIPSRLELRPAEIALVCDS